MSRIEVPFADVPEETLAPEGNYDLRIVGKESGLTKKGDRSMITCLIRIEGGPYSAMRHWLVFPNEHDEQNTRDLMVRNIRRFLAIFNVKWDGTSFDDDDLDGATGRCLVSLRKNEETGTEYNELRLPRVRE